MEAMPNGELEREVEEDRISSIQLSTVYIQIFQLSKVGYDVDIMHAEVRRVISPIFIWILTIDVSTCSKFAADSATLSSSLSWCCVI